MVVKYTKENLEGVKFYSGGGQPGNTYTIREGSIFNATHGNHVCSLNPEHVKAFNNKEYQIVDSIYELWN